MWQQISAELSSGGGPSNVIIAVRITGSILLCGLIGYEREIHKNTAGLRTNILVGVASAAFALITLTMLDTPLAGDDVRADPIRLVEAVTNGVAFLAAGIVVFSKGGSRSDDRRQPLGLGSHWFVGWPGLLVNRIDVDAGGRFCVSWSSPIANCYRAEG